MKVLLLSNSTNFGENYMEWCASTIGDYVKKDKEKIVFIPYAAIGFSYEMYTNRVNQALVSQGIEVINIALAEDPKELLSEATAIFVGGGNTFQLNKLLWENDLVDLIKEKVAQGVPYVGWSAGSNVCGPSIRTTNDMPVVEPPTFEALSLVPFSINPHYTEKSIPNHGGETRMQRLQEFIAINQDQKVVCLPEATYCELEGDRHIYHGKRTGYVLSDLGVVNLHDGDEIEL